ncbi:hypothetical protein P4B35_01995 [Pontiellaceae bacterium B12227]|nr:hypothetical protein [Pontiellaceae bacterium B12227]
MKMMLQIFKDDSRLSGYWSKKTYMLLMGFFLCAAGVVPADELVLAGGGNSFNSVDGKNGTIDLINANGGDLAWDIGEEISISFDLSIANPDVETRGGVASFMIGVGDGNAEGRALGFGLGMWNDDNDYLAASIDKLYKNGNNFSINLTTSGNRASVAVPDENDLRDHGERAHFTFKATRVDINSYTVSVTWAGESISGTVAAAEPVEFFNELIFRANEEALVANTTWSVSNLRMKVKSEERTIGLLTM